MKQMRGRKLKKFTKILFTPNFTIVFLTLHNGFKKEGLESTNRRRQVKINGYFTKFVPHGGRLIDKLTRRSWSDKEKFLSMELFEKAE